jgi:hypothetical protein
LLAHECCRSSGVGMLGVWSRPYWLWGLQWPKPRLGSKNIKLAQFLFNML